MAETFFFDQALILTTTMHNVSCFHDKLSNHMHVLKENGTMEQRNNGTI